MADLSKPMRAVRLTLKLDADDMRELSYALRTLADHAERNELTTGVMGGAYSGYIYELLVDPTITHDSYHAALREYLDGLKNQQAEPVHIAINNPVQIAECGGPCADGGPEPARTRAKAIQDMVATSERAGLYELTAEPVQRKPLTEEELQKVLYSVATSIDAPSVVMTHWPLVARAIERAHGIKEEK